MVLLRIIECIWNVRYIWGNVDRFFVVCVRLKKFMDTVALAGMESGFCNDFFGTVDTSLKCYDWSFLDSNPIQRTWWPILT